MITGMLTSNSLRAPERRDRHRAWRFAVDHCLLLPLGGGIALIWANAAPSSYFTLAQGLMFPVNEIAMALFFGLVTQEVMEAALPGGALHTWRRWLLPVAAATGATIGGGLVYSAYVNIVHEAVLAPGWPIAAAIDLAFAYFLVKSIFGRHPAVPFVLLTAIVADVLGIAFIASRHAFVDVRPGGLALMALALVSAIMLRRFKVRTFWPHLLISGSLSWWALYLDGLHPAFALVPIVPFMPHTHRGLDLFTDRPHSTHDSSRHFEHVWHYPVQGVLFFFALANAGVLIQGYGSGTWALLAASLVGKPAGLMAGCIAAVAAGLHLPRGLHWKDLAVIAPATAASFTVGLFFATAAFPMGPILGELKIGAVATGISVPLTYAAAVFLGAGRFTPGRRRVHA